MTIIHTRSSKCFIKQDGRYVGISESTMVNGGEWVGFGDFIKATQDLFNATRSMSSSGSAHIEFIRKPSIAKPIKNDWYRKFDKRKF